MTGTSVIKDYVIDASALILLLVGKSRGADALRARLPSMRRHAPHLVDAEVGNVLRRHEQRGLISHREAVAALAASGPLVDHRYPHTGALSDLAWTWRANLSFDDALYVALADRLGCALLTTDARLGRAPGVDVEVEVL